MGRPTLYRPELCDRVVELGKQGLTLHEIAAEIGIHYDTLHEWTLSKSDFSEAVTRARALAQAWFETQARLNLSSREFNAKLWEILARCRFPATYRPVEQLQVINTVAGLEEDLTQSIVNAAKAQIKKA